MKKTISAFAFVANLSMTVIGCSAPEELDNGYQLGDITHIVVREEAAIIEAKNNYCNTAKDNAIRAAALRVIRLKYPFIPENGICGSDNNQGISSGDGQKTTINIQQPSG